MIIEVPASDSDHLPDNLKPKDLTYKSEAVFHWPADCLWPFTDHRSEGDS
jgi:hypothetical protein